MKAITVRNMKIGDGAPKICVPLAAADAEDLFAQAEAVAQEQPDLVEWRVDYLAAFATPARQGEMAIARWESADIPALLSGLRQRLRDLPLLFTLRTAPEGGQAQLSPAEYADIIRAAAEWPEVDLIDIEGLQAERQPAERIAEVFRAGKVSLASAHFFDRALSEEESMDVLFQLEEIGADLVKLATTAEKPEDAYALMRATRRAADISERPLVTMAMGEAGVITRTTGRLTGSAITFGTVDKSTAPGQLPVRELRELLHKI